jgi:hypothetical protein
MRWWCDADGSYSHPGSQQHKTLLAVSGPTRKDLIDRVPHPVPSVVKGIAGEVGMMHWGPIAMLPWLVVMACAPLEDAFAEPRRGRAFATGPV